MAFPFRKLEEKWKIYDEKQFNSHKKDKYYLNMFPYPSGNIHMGHIRNFTITDIVTRFSLLQGIKVFNPIGWDAFGLPAENAAIENNTHPKIWTENNIENMKTQLKNMGFKFNWDYEMGTHQETYYKFQQQLFREMYKLKLIYRKKEWVNWDPVEKTVLANEQVDKNGKAWRSKVKVEKKYMYQWFIKISDYAQDLLDGLESLKNKWPNRVLLMQKNWIGKSTGYIIDFTYENKKISVYTTKPETIYGCTFLAISPFAPMAHYILEDKLEDLINNNDTQNIQIGHVIHPLTKEKIPLYLADYVISDYGTGAVMGCPAHDERDEEFAKKFNLPIKKVIEENHIINSNNNINGLTIEEARKILNFPQKTLYKLKDWCISRQRYWGCPIPIIHCKNCNIILDENIVKLPDNIGFTAQNNILNSDWKNIKCPKCNGDAQRETSTMDTFVDSSWYFLRFPCVFNNSKILDENISILPVDLYVGGVEHAILHLLYARFMTRVFHRLKLIDFKEPFNKLINQGMLCHATYRGKNSKKYYEPREVEKKDNKFFVNNEEVLEGPMEKMSKSLKNIVQPSDIINVFGSDVIKFFIVSDTPVEKDSQWDNSAMRGCWRFLGRIWDFKDQINQYVSHDNNNSNFQVKFNNFINEIYDSVEKVQLNLLVSHIRMLFTLIKDTYKTGEASKDQLLNAFKFLLQSLWCICPFISYEIFQIVFNSNITEHQLPTRPVNVTDNKVYEIVVRINGKKSSGSFFTENTQEEYIVNRAKKFLANLNYKKYIYVQNKLINFLY